MNTGESKTTEIGITPETERRTIKDPWISDRPLRAMLEDRGIVSIKTEVGYSIVGDTPLVETPIYGKDGVSFASNGLYANRYEKTGRDFHIDFTPFHEVSRVRPELQAMVLFKGYIAMSDFIKFAEHYYLSDDFKVSGTTNPVMANMAERFGFKTWSEIGEVDVSVSSTVGEIKNAISHFGNKSRHGEKVISMLEKKS